jgi:hypothetical protein
LRRGQFAIHLSIRNNGNVKRGVVIEQVAAKVGPGHKVDLTHYDKLIIVDVHRVSTSELGVSRDLTRVGAERLRHERRRRPIRRAEAIQSR